MGLGAYREQGQWQGPEAVVPAGGDAFISICMWQAGYAVTDPGFSFYHPEIQMMDPGPEDRLGIMMKLARALDANRCDERCRVHPSPPTPLPLSVHLPTDQPLRNVPAGHA